MKKGQFNDIKSLFYCVFSPDQPTCIDLTNEMENEDQDVVDLTNLSAVAESPIVVIS